LLKKLLVAAVLSSVTAFAADTKAAKATGPTDPQIAHIAVTANQIDVDAAKQALEKSKNEKVRQLAQSMVDDHTSVIQQATELVTKLKVTPEDNDTSKQLKAGGDKAKAEIGAKSGEEFDRAYVANEVAYHEAVIDAVHKVLIPNAKNKELKALLQKVEPVLHKHLEHAKMLQKELAAK
jgi:putative membrane protein